MKRVLSTGVLAGALCAACGFEPTREITSRRMASQPSLPVEVGATAEQRFRASSEPEGHDAAPSDLANLFRFDLPEGWKALRPTADRLVHVQPAGDPESSCYLSLLQGNAGGLPGNVNRWRAQFGQGALSSEEIAALPTVPLLNRRATLLEVEGSFTGMDGLERPGQKLLGLAVCEEAGSLFVKFTGPAARVDAERERFFEFVASIGVHEDHGGHSADDGHDHGPQDPVHEDDAPLVDDGSTSSSLSWKTPEEWAELGARPMREVTFAIGGAAGAESGAECYVTRLGGDAGGLRPNLDRWCSQFGRGGLSDEEFEALERVEMLGTEVAVLELTGDFEGMDGVLRKEQGLLGVALVRPMESLFVKLVGPRELVLAERDAFVAFVTSLEEDGSGADAEEDG